MNSIPFYLCSGFHRSGTSLVSLSMLENGVDMGATLMGPSISNANGHGEDQTVVDLHDHFLEINGTDWRYADDHDLILPSNSLELMKGYLSQRWQQFSGGSVGYGVKDPRAVLFLQDWFGAAEGNIRFILVYRNWKFAVSSLLKRHSRNILQSHEEIKHRREDIDFWRDADLAAKMWLLAAEKMLECFALHPQKTLLFDQAAFVQNNDTLCDIAATKDIHPKALKSNSFDATLMQQNIPQSMLDMLSPKTIARCEQVNQQLQEVSDLSAPTQVSARQPHIYIDRVLGTSAFTFTSSGEGSSSDEKVVHHNKLRFAGKSVADAIAVMKKLDRRMLGNIDWDYWLGRPEPTANETIELFYLAVKAKMPLVAEVFLSRAVIIRDIHWQWMHLGNHYFNAGFIANAKRCYQTAFEKNAKNAGVIAKLADINTAEGHYSQSEQCIRKAQEIEPDNPAIKDAKIRLNRALKKQQDEALFEKHKHTLFTPEADYTALVEAFEVDKKLGRKLDRYMAQAHFILRDNIGWLQRGCEPLGQEAARCFLDYLFSHLDQIWPKETLMRTFFPAEPQTFSLSSTSGKGKNTASVETEYQLGVHIHAFYAEAVPEILSFLQVLPDTTKIVITTPEKNMDGLAELSSPWSNCVLIPVQNRGKDMAAWLLHAAPHLQDCNLVLKLHTKSTQQDSALAGWPLQLLWSLLGDSSIVSRVLNAFSSNPFTGLMLPPFYPAAVKHIDWEQPIELPDIVVDKLNLDETQDSISGYYPVGRMFWYRPDALSALINADWCLEDFDEKQDGEERLITGLERTICKLAEMQGYGYHFIDVFPKIFRM